MAKAKMKTVATEANPLEFLNAIEHKQRREDGLRLLEFFNDLTGLKPKMWGPSIIGYGRYAYKYDSGREGEFFLTGFSPRKASLSMYIMPGYRDMTDTLNRLGKHKIGKACLYINKLDDVDMEVLAEIVEDGLAEMRTKCQTWDE